MSAIAVAAGLDVLVAEPPARYHPVTWMGRYLTWAGRYVPSGPAGTATIAGGLAWAAGATLCFVAGAQVQRCSRGLRPAARTAVTATALWTLCSGRLLHHEVRAVEQALDRGPDRGRAQLSRIVSRDTSTLTPAEVRASAMESLAENLSDSVVAPVFWYLVGGLPGAAAYRFTNTADAMWGYRSSRWVHGGTVAARADDLLNVVPARLTAFALLPSAATAASVRRRLRHEAGRTPSPNGGWPMGALALSLDVRLAKPDHYALNATGRSPRRSDVRAALRRTTRVAVTTVAVAICAERMRRRPQRKDHDD